MLAIEVNRAGAFGGENIDAEFKEFHLDGGCVRLALGAFDRCDEMPHALLIHLRGADLNALVSDIADAATKALLAEFFFDIDAGGLQVKGFALGAGGILRHALVSLVPIGTDTYVGNQRYTQLCHTRHLLSHFNSYSRQFILRNFQHQLIMHLHDEFGAQA